MDYIRYLSTRHTSIITKNRNYVLLVFSDMFNDKFQYRPIVNCFYCRKTIFSKRKYNNSKIIDKSLNQITFFKNITIYVAYFYNE